jgi:hypothetical protein
MKGRADMKGISFGAVLVRIATTIDGGWRLTLDVSQSDAEEMLKLAKLRNQSFQIGVVPLDVKRPRLPDDEL